MNLIVPCTSKKQHKKIEKALCKHGLIELVMGCTPHNDVLSVVFIPEELDAHDYVALCKILHKFKGSTLSALHETR